MFNLGAITPLGVRYGQKYGLAIVDVESLYSHSAFSIICYAPAYKVQTCKQDCFQTDFVCKIPGA